MANVLTKGSIEDILGKGTTGLTPTLQVIMTSELQQGKNRWKVVLSDGVYSAQAMVTGEAAMAISAGQVKLFSLIKLNDYQINFLSVRKLLIVLKIDIISHVHSQIGISTPYPVGGDEPMMQQMEPAQPVQVGGAGAGGGGGGGGGYGAGAGNPVVRPSTSPTQTTFMPIAQLNPYLNRWTIKVRLTSKGEIKSWQNERGAGKLFKCELLDAQGGEIGAAFFKDAVDKFYDNLHVGSVYAMSGGRVKVADKKFSNGREYELNFDEKSMITLVVDDAAIKSMNFALVPIADLAAMDPESKKNFDIMGYIQNVDDVMDMVSKAGKNLTKRNVLVADDSGCSVNITVWGESARDFKGTVGQVIAVKNCSVSGWDGRTVSTGFSSVVQLDPDHDHCERIRAFFEADPMRQLTALSQRGGGGGGAAVESAALLAGLADLSLRKMACEIKETSAQDGALESFLIRASVDVISSRKEVDKIMYPACKAITEKSRKCQKKLDDLGGGNWKCNNCGVQDGPEYRYIISVGLNDGTSNCIATLFNTEGEQFLGMSADKLHAEVMDAGEGGQTKLDELLLGCKFQDFICTAKAKMENVKEEQRLKTSITKLRPLVGDTLVKENRALVDAIKKYVA